jgi:hypothetical protein
MKNTKTNELTGTPPVGFSELLGERLTRVIQLREHQDKTFKEIGQAIGCGAQRAAQLYHTAKRRQERHAQGESADPYYGLSVRTSNCCNNRNLMNREQIAAAIKDGTLHPRASAHCRNFGWKSYKEIHKWLGLPEPVKTVRVYVAKVCPHCGGKLA